MKKVNIAMLALLLVLQVLFSPLTVFAEGDPLSSLPAAGESAGNETVEEVQEDTETSGDVSTEPTDETNTDEGTDAGSEEGTDEGTDAGTEEGTDEGTDAGSEKSAEEGTDAGTEEGTGEGTDAGTEEGAVQETDAGSEEDTEGEVDEATEEGTEEDLLASLMALPANMQADVKMNFTGLRLYDPNGHLIVEADDLFSYTGPNPKKGDNVFLSYVFEVEPSQDYGIGSSFEFPMPANMIEEYFDGSFDQARSLEETGDWLAYHSTYDSDAKTVTVTLDSELEEGSVGTIQFTFNSRFGNFADENELEQDLIIPIEGGASTTLPFKFDPLGSGNLLTKSAGAINRAEDGTVSIPWTI